MFSYIYKWFEMTCNSPVGLTWQGIPDHVIVIIVIYLVIVYPGYK